jgi:outer membrane usher protein
MKRRSFKASRSRVFAPRLSTLFAALVPIFLAQQSWADVPNAQDSSSAQDDEKGAAPAATVTFNSAFLRGSNGAAVDLSAFEDDNGILPGDYDVDVYVNGEFLQNQKLSFRGSSAREKAHPCLSRQFLETAGVLDEFISMEPQMECGFIDEIVRGSRDTLDTSRMRLDLTIPQAYMRRVVKGYVPMSAWDAGEPVAFINYSGNYYNNSYGNSGGSLNSTYFNLQGGLNVGKWQLRNSSAFRYTPRNGSQFTSGNTYLQRALPNMRSNLLLGEASTSGTIFDSIGFRGARLSSDDRMLSPNQQGYAPVIRGTAGSNARVVVRQGANVVYETSVPPGDFVIDDLYPTLNSGDLTVEVTEASGRTSSFTVPFSAVSTSLRPGLARYSVTAGRTHASYNNTDDVSFVEATYERGINNQLTLNGGLLGASNRYYSLAAGGVLATTLGAFGAGVNYARSNTANLASSGWQFKAVYNATYSPTGTSVMLGAYRYSTSGYISLLDSLAAGNAPYYINDAGAHIRSDSFRQRSRFELSVNQPLGRIGSIHASTIRQDYYGAFKPNTQYQVNFQSSVGPVAYSIGFGRQTQASSWGNGAQGSQNFFMLSAVIPLGKNNTVSTGATHYSGDGTLFQTNLSGGFGADRRYSYNINQSTDQRNHVTSGGVNVSRNSSFGTFGAGYTKSSDSSSFSATARGVLVADRHGVLAGPYVGDTFGIVEAPGAEGARLTSASGVVLNRSGRAIIPSLSPYRYNFVTLDPTGMPGNAELEETQKRVAPYAGAVPRIQFKTRRGYPVLISAELPGGKPLPLGAKVVDEAGDEVGVVGQGSQLYARVVESHGKLLAVWGKDEGEKCTLDYGVPKQDETRTLIRMHGICQF